MLTPQEQESLERSDIIIDGAVDSWDMRIEGDILGTYAGAFKFRCYLTPLQQIAAERERRELLGAHGLYAQEHESFLAYALTQLKHRIVAAPPFWTSQSPASMAGDIADENVIAAILDAALGAEIKYKSQLKKRKLDALARGKAGTEKLMKGNDEAPEDEDDDEGESQEG